MMLGLCKHYYIARLPVTVTYKKISILLDDLASLSKLILNSHLEILPTHIN